MTGRGRRTPAGNFSGTRTLQAFAFSLAVKNSLIRADICRNWDISLAALGATGLPGASRKNWSSSLRASLRSSQSD